MEFEGPTELHNSGDRRTSDTSDRMSAAPIPRVLFLTNFLPYPLDHGGAMARESMIRALSGSASVSVMVMTSIGYDDAVLRAAGDYYRRFCSAFSYHRFDSLSPHPSILAKIWDYVRGYPRHG